MFQTETVPLLPAKEVNEYSELHSAVQIDDDEVKVTEVLTKKLIDTVILVFNFPWKQYNLFKLLK